jgi:hypothetical protein
LAGYSSRPGRRKQKDGDRSRSSIRGALSACVAGAALAGCTWLYGPAVELPKDTASAVEKPGVGARALLRANQCDAELASWGPALQSAIDSLGESVDPAQQTALRAAIRRSYGTQRLFDRMATSLASSWDPDAAREVFDFYGTWLGDRVLRAQASRRDARTLAKFQEWSADVDTNAYSVERIELLQRIDRALLTSQTACG